MGQRRRVIILSSVNLGLAILIAMWVGGGCGLADLDLATSPEPRLKAEGALGFPQGSWLMSIEEWDDQVAGSFGEVLLFSFLVAATEFRLGSDQAELARDNGDSQDIFLFAGTNLVGSPARTPSRSQINNMPRQMQFRLEARDEQGKRLLNMRFPRMRLNRKTGNYATVMITIDKEVVIPQDGSINLYRRIKGSSIKPMDRFEYGAQIFRVPAGAREAAGS